MMKFKGREVFVVRPYDELRVVVQEPFTGNQEVAEKNKIEGYTEEVDSKEVKTGQALNKGDQEQPKRQEEEKNPYIKARLDAEKEQLAEQERIAKESNPQPVVTLQTVTKQAPKK